MKKRTVLQLLCFAVLFGIFLSFSSVNAVYAEETTKTDSDKAPKTASEKGFQEFAGVNFGVGLAMTFKHGENRVESASIQNEIVRVDKESNRTPKVMLEAHYFFQPGWSWMDKILKEKPEDRTNWGIGPFVAIHPGDSGGKVIDTYGIGVLMGFRRKDQADNTRTSWNIGFGYVVTTGTKVLGDGIEENQPLPPGETEVRYKETNQPGWMIMASFSW